MMPEAGWPPGWPHTQPVTDVQRAASDPNPRLPEDDAAAWEAEDHALEQAREATWDR